jgi:hypothetical protein
LYNEPLDRSNVGASGDVGFLLLIVEVSNDPEA